MHDLIDDSSKIEGQQLLSVEQAAECLEVPPAELARWLSEGILTARQRPSNNEPVVRVFDLIAASRLQQRRLPPCLAGFDQRVLIAEDDAAMASAIERVLRSAGYHASIAPDGFQASSIVETYCPAVILLDLNMPHMRGIEVLKHLRSSELYAHIGIIVVSAGTPEQLAGAKNAGADRVLEKPFSNEHLLATIGQLLRR